MYLVKKRGEERERERERWIKVYHNEKGRFNERESENRKSLSAIERD